MKATLLLAALLLAAAPVSGQRCGAVPAPADGLGILAEAGLVRHDIPGQPTGIDLGVRVAWAPPAVGVSVGGGVRGFDPGPSLVHGNASLATRLPALPWIGQLCARAGAAVGFLSDDRTATSYTAVTVPLALVFSGGVPVGGATAQPFIAPGFVIGVTSGESLGLDIGETHAAPALEAGVTVVTGPVAARVAGRWNDLAPALGTHPLGQFAVEIALGVALPR